MSREPVRPEAVKELGRLFASRSIALIGATPRDDRIYPNLRKFFNGKVYPVNPKYSEVYGLQCYPSLKETPGDVECAAVMVPRDSVLQALEDCGQNSVRYVVVFAAGFSEVGEEGKRLDARMREIAQKFHMTIIGPNSSGFINTEGLSPFWLPNVPVPTSTRGIGIVSQSGGILSNVYRLGVLRKLGFSYVISSGNETVTKTTDYLSFLVADDRTRVIVLVVEGVDDGAELKRAFEKAREAGKPIVLLKLGLSEKGNATVALHSGRMATGGLILQALCRQSGVVWADGIDKILDVAEILAKAKPSGGNRVGIAMFSGGLGVYLSDWAERLGLELPAPSAKTRELFSSLLSVPKSGLENPFDLQPQLIASQSSTLIRALADDGNYDWILIRAPLLQSQMPEFLAQVKQASHRASQPVVCFTPTVAEKYESDETVPVIGGAENVMAAIKATIQRRPSSVAPGTNTDESRLLHARGLLSRAQEVPLSFELAALIMGFYGVPTVRTQITNTVADAVDAAARIGYPVVLKSDGPLHRTEQGKVKTDVRNESELRDAFSSLAGPTGGRAPPILVQEYARGVEMIAGFRADPVMGSSIFVGTGGIFAEALADFAIRIPPVSAEEAKEMITELKGYSLLAGHRGRPRADIEALARAVVSLSEFAVDSKDLISELDINPVFVLDEGRGVMAADIKIVSANAANAPA